MTSAGQTVCLCMIVKNERHVLQRCLQSVRSLIDCWLIVDTGSSDGTQEFIQECYQDIRGRVVERPWRNFGWNRSEALSLAQPMADYVFTLDADEYVQTSDGNQPDAEFRWPALTNDAYTFAVHSGDVMYSRIQLMRTALPWRYEGVLHEFATCDGAHSEQRMPGIVTVRLLEGARSRDPLTYRRDASLLEEALLNDPDNARHVFYLAQSYRDAGEPHLALRHYQRRATMGGWSEEMWCAMLESAKLLQQTGEPWPVVQAAYLDAYRYRPWRAEPLYYAGLSLQEAGCYSEALEPLRQAVQLPVPTQDSLFIEMAVYRFLVLRDFIVTCFALDLRQEAVATADRALANDMLLATERLWMEEARRRLLAPTAPQQTNG